jgi:hypothetical protein
MKDEARKTTMIEVISFLFFTLFAMILAFFTSAKAFATPGDACATPTGDAHRAAVTCPAPAKVPARTLPF